MSTDILSFPGIDVVADAHRLPFPNAMFSGVVMLDVLHHLERPIEFLKEASRVLRPGGRLAMIEPAMTTLARRFYDRFHEEPVDMTRRPVCTSDDQSRSGPVRRQPGHPHLAVRHRRRRAGGSSRLFRRCGCAASTGRACSPIR